MRDDNRQQWLHTLQRTVGASEKNWWIAFGLSFLLGWLGVDRLYVGSLGLGLAKLVTLGGAGIWWAFDVMLLLVGAMRDADEEVVQRPF